jgi:hypothetical protein
MGRRVVSRGRKGSEARKSEVCGGTGRPGWLEYRWLRVSHHGCGPGRSSVPLRITVHWNVGVGSLIRVGGKTGGYC